MLRAQDWRDTIVQASALSQAAGRAPARRSAAARAAAAAPATQQPGADPGGAPGTEGTGRAGSGLLAAGVVRAYHGVSPALVQDLCHAAGELRGLCHADRSSSHRSSNPWSCTLHVQSCTMPQSKVCWALPAILPMQRYSHARVCTGVSAGASVDSVSDEQWQALWGQWQRWLRAVQAGDFMPTSDEAFTR